MTSHRRTLRLSVIGTGYLGATHAACMAELGYEVIGLDIDQAKIDVLRTGSVPFYEPGLDEVLARNIEADRLTFTTSFEEIAAFADIHFVCVGTPQAPGAQRADLSQVFGSIESLAPHLRADALVVGKSTVPVGTAAEIEAILGATAASGVEVAWNPEFLREGYAVQDTLHPDRLVVGAHSPRAEALLREGYAPIIDEGVPFLVTDFPTAELVKVAANSFLATKISFINAMAELCDATGGDVTQLATAIGYDDRIGAKFLRAGVGFGGGCLPKDIRAFMARAGELGVDEALTFLREVDAINLRQRDKAVELAAELLDGRFVGNKVTVLGAAFKPNSDDLRDSPALDIAERIWARGADVVITDPAAGPALRVKRPNLQVVDDLDEALRDADLVLLLTEWREFVALDPVRTGELVRTRKIVDGRNVLDPNAWMNAGWTYRGMGRHGGPTTTAGW